MSMDMVTFVVVGGAIKPRITLPNSATIFELKQKIQELVGVPIAQQTLLYDGTKLMDGCAVKDYSFETVTTVVLVVGITPNELYINITITCPAFKITLRVNRMDTVFQLKKRIGEMWGIEPEAITLWHHFTRMKDLCCLCQYYITEGSDVLFTRTGYDD